MHSFATTLNTKQHKLIFIVLLLLQQTLQQNMSIVVRKSQDRGHAHHGWLNTYHTFSFAGYYDPDFASFGNLRVLNEDRVSASDGFGTHPHADYEIFSYVVNGALRHKDSMGNIESIKRGDIQFTTAGTGIAHSEYNDSDKEEVHFLQIWVKPNARGLKPSYQTKHFSEADKKGKLVKVISPVGSLDTDTIKINQDFNMYASILNEGEKVSHNFGNSRRGYIHLVMNKTGASVTLKGKSGAQVTLHEGDGAFITAEEAVEIQGECGVSEFVFCDLV